MASWRPLWKTGISWRRYVSQLSANWIHRARIRPGLSGDVRGQALYRWAANGTPADELFRVALVGDRHRDLWGALELLGDGDWRHDRRATHGTNDGDHRRGRHGFLATRCARVRAYRG